MKKDEIPFKIGMQYENWEFSLDIVPDRIKGLDSYLNVDETLNRFVNFNTDRTELIFSLDILEGVILTFENCTTSFYNNLKHKIFLYVELFEGLSEVFSSECEDYSNRLAHCILYMNKTVCILYCNGLIFQALLGSLIGNNNIKSEK